MPPRTSRRNRAIPTTFAGCFLAWSSWNAARDDPDRHATFAKRLQASFWQLLPIRPLL